jgi:hypothetical protein
MLRRAITGVGFPTGRHKARFVGAFVETEGGIGRLTSDDADPVELTDMVKHWVSVIDRWVERLDEGMGGAADGAEPGIETDSPADSAPGPT